MAYRVQAIRPGAPPDEFPDPATMGAALGQPDGLLAIGGDLSPERLIAAYQRGIFPWYNDDQPILWWCPSPRAVIEVPRFHRSRSLRKMLRAGGWEFSVNQDFAAVIGGCASDRGAHGTWITPEMRAAYMQLHELGYAHSVESWCAGEFAGGIYGIRLGDKFFGESMVTRLSGGSKAAITALIHLCELEGIDLLDCQVSSPHLETLGMTEISRQEFLRRLQGLSSDALPFTADCADGKCHAADFLGE